MHSLLRNLSFVFLALTLSLSQAQAQKIAPALKYGEPLPANAFVELAKLINPAVVNISTSTMPKGRQMRDPLLEMMEQFYGYKMNPRGGPGVGPRPAQALGTGFIIREDGLIITNAHVIAGADVIQVQIEEKGSKMFEAKVIGLDDRTDIALIKIESAQKFPVAQLGSSKDLEVGEWVAAFGNPFGQGHTMTKGIISAKGREIGEINKFPLIQTDTPINPGNSGGPLVSMKGLVIGVNSAIDARAQGIGFAIPIDEVKAILPQLEKTGRIQKGFLGVGLDDLTPQAVQYLGLKDDNGALIVAVEKGGAADRGGVQTYDVIVEFNERKIDNVRQLMDSVADAPIGKSVKVVVMREGKKRNLNITVAERPADPRRGRQEIKKFYGQKAPFDLGFMLADSTAQIRKDFEVSKEAGNSPVVIEVAVNSPAAVGGLQPGDVILEVNKKQTKSATEVLKQFKKGANLIRVARAGGFAILTLSTP